VRQIEQETIRIETEENQILQELARLHERMEALENSCHRLRAKIVNNYVGYASRTFYGYLFFDVLILFYI